MQQSQDNQNLSFLRPEESVGGAMQFQAVLKNMLGKMHTVMLVEVVDVDAKGIGDVGTVDIRPMVMMIDAENNVIERGTIYKVPFFRLQSGGNAVVIDPQKGDIGIALFCERDISTVVRTKADAAPNTKRQFDLSDALYLGAFLGSAPAQYIYFKESGIDIKSTGGINITSASDVNINGMTVKNDGTLLTKDGDVVDKHTHGGVTSGLSNTKPLGG